MKEALARNALLMGEAEALAKAFAEARVPLVFLKGAAMLLRGLACGSRAMADLDLLVRARERARAEAVLLSLGYRRTASTASDFAKPGARWCVDLHPGLWHAREEALWREVRRARGAFKTLSLEAMAVHCAAHSVLNSGCLGERARGDLRVILRAPGFDWARLCSHAREIGLEALTAAALRALARDGESVPPRVEARLLRGPGRRVLALLFAAGCSRSPSLACEYLLPFAAAPAAAWRLAFPPREELERRRGEGCFCPVPRRAGELVGNLIRKAFSRG